MTHNSIEMFLDHNQGFIWSLNENLSLPGGVGTAADLHPTLVYYAQAIKPFNDMLYLLKHSMELL